MDNVRTKEEINRQKQEHSQHREGGTSANDGAVARVHRDATTDDGYIFNASDIIEDTGDAYIVPHGNHFHYIPKSDLSAELAAAEPFYLVEVANQIRLLIAVPITTVLERCR